MPFFVVLVGFAPVECQAVPLTGIIFSIVILRVGHQSHGDSFYARNATRSGTISWAVKRRTTAPTITATTIMPQPRSGGQPTTVPLEVFVHDSTVKRYDAQSEEGHSQAKNHSIVNESASELV